MFVPDVTGRTGPKYKVLADVFEEAILRGELTASSKLPSQRILSYKLAVTVGTITRAYKELERRGLTQPVVGSGTYIKDIKRERSDYYHPVVTQGGIDMRLCRPLILNQRKHLHSALLSLSSETDAQQAVLDYFTADGLQGHSDTLQLWLNQSWKSQINQRRLQWTYGGQHALNALVQALTRAGDSILVEGLCYAEFINTCVQLERKVVPVSIDQQGMDIEDLELHCRRHQPRLLYLTPHCQNPTGVRLSDDRRLKIIEICRRHQVLIVEDGVPYCPPSHRSSPLVNVAPDITLYVGSFSKYFAGGVRIGYMVIPEGLKPQVQKALRTSCMHVSPILIDLVCRWLKSGAIDQVDQEIALELRARYRLLSHYFSISEQHVPGIHYWLPIPENLDCGTLQSRLSERGVYVRDAYFYQVGAHPIPNAIRLSLTGPSSRAELKSGLEIISSEIHSSTS